MKISASPATRAQTPIQTTSTKMVMAGQITAPTPAAADSSASSSQPATGPTRSLLNARALSVPAARKAYTANKIAMASRVMPAQAIEMTPTMTARMPRPSRAFGEVSTVLLLGPRICHAQTIPHVRTNTRKWAAGHAAVPRQ
jgi:hypothetical protein